MTESAGEIRIEYDAALQKGRLNRVGAVAALPWNGLVQLAASLDATIDPTSDEIVLDWNYVLELTPFLSDIRREHSVSISYGGEAYARLSAFAQAKKAVAEASGSFSAPDPATMLESLSERGFGRRDGPLKPEQIENIERLIRLPNGANFSVPGAGKTTVALAVCTLVDDDDTTVMVIAPKNAFQAWDVAVEECFAEDTRDAWFFTRLEGGAEAIGQALLLGKRRYIVSYDQFVRVRGVLATYLGTRPTHVILDESHRIKSGDRSLRGAAVGSIAHLPIRRDILSGTPMPLSKDDLVPQFEFLWPGHGIGSSIRFTQDIAPIIRPLYVRTTKAQLGLVPPIRKFTPVPMSDAQVALYGIMRDETLKRARRISGASLSEIDQARRCIMRLMQVSSNPLLYLRSTGDDGGAGALRDHPALAAICDQIVSEFDSPKLLTACERARELAAAGRKSVIWSSFTWNVERIAERLDDIGAAFIHGGVPTGSDEDPATREYKLKRFNTDPSAMVLVANPAACGEAISLHRACHYAIYMDRSFNAAHYLQSVDRIHRLGLPPDTETFIEVLESVSPSGLGSLDYSVRRRMIVKLRDMASALNDQDVSQLALEEDEADAPIDYDMDLADIEDLIDELEGRSAEAGVDEDL